MDDEGGQQGEEPLLLGRTSLTAGRPHCNDNQELEESLLQY